VGSNAKKKTTFAKLNRENKLRERQQRKQVRKDARREAAAAEKLTEQTEPAEPGPAPDPEAA
jgi:hypothetical protein